MRLSDTMTTCRIYIYIYILSICSVQSRLRSELRKSGQAKLMGLEQHCNLKSFDSTVAPGLKKTSMLFWSHSGSEGKCDPVCCGIG